VAEPTPKDGVLIASTVDVVDAHNKKCVHELCETIHGPTHYFDPVISEVREIIKMDEVTQKNKKQIIHYPVQNEATQCLVLSRVFGKKHTQDYKHRRLWLKLGVPVTCKWNTRASIRNGTPRVVVGFERITGHPIIATESKANKYKADNGEWGFYKTDLETGDAVVVQPMQKNVTIYAANPLRQTSTHYHVEWYPLLVRYAVTVHSSQGLTFDGPVVVDLSKQFMNGLAPVAVSRSRQPFRLTKPFTVDTPFRVDGESVRESDAVVAQTRRILEWSTSKPFLERGRYTRDTLFT
jgi:ATP-dependent exoDNAse (exonuclease V) alpha subunit